MVALTRLKQVMMALTPRHVDVVVCLANKLRDNPEMGGEHDAVNGFGARGCWCRRCGLVCGGAVVRVVGVIVVLA